MKIEGRIDPDQAASNHKANEKFGIGTDDEDLGSDSEETGVVNLPPDMVDRLRIDLSVWKLR